MPAVHIDPEWLRDTCVTRGLSIPAIAAESRSCAGTIYRRLRSHSIPVRTQASAPPNEIRP
jgi:hypothetical protein